MPQVPLSREQSCQSTCCKPSQQQMGHSHAVWVALVRVLTRTRPLQHSLPGQPALAQAALASYGFSSLALAKAAPPTSGLSELALHYPLLDEMNSKLVSSHPSPPLPKKKPVKKSYKPSLLSHLVRLRLDVTANWVEHPCLVLLSEAKSRKHHCCELIISLDCRLQLVLPFSELKNGP